jgi:hypothetical protein
MDQFPFNYLGIPIHFRRLQIVNGNTSRRDCKRGSTDGKKNYYP